MLTQQQLNIITELLKQDKDVILSYQKSKQQLIIKTIEAKKVNI